jgi:hypothetical protein
MLKKTEMRMAGKNRFIAAAWAVILLIGSCRSAPLSAFDGFQASAESYAAAEAERQAAVQRQVQLNDALRWQAGFPPANGVFYYPFLPSLDSIYASERLDWFGYGMSGRPAPGDDVFSPWPFVRGDLWSYRYVPPSRQPIGRVEMQTGPNRWESRPIYAAPAPLPRPVVVGPPPLEPETVPEEMPPPIRGPREF